MESWVKYPVTFAFGLMLCAILGILPYPVMDTMRSHENLEKERYVADRASRIVMIEVLRTICVNTSETNAEKNNCHKGAIVADVPLSYADDSI